MTLIVGIPARDGVVFGSDSQVTAGVIRATGTKIFPLNNGALWGASGELALIQRVAERIDGLARRDQPLAAIRDELATAVKDAAQALITMDFRTQFMIQNPVALLGLHPGDFLFVECQKDLKDLKGTAAPRILHIMVNGTPEWIDGRFAVTGNGDMFAHALLSKYSKLLPMARDQAKLLAYKVIEEAIDVGAYGLGPPIAIWEVSPDGVLQADEAELSGLDDSARLLREQEVDMFLDRTPPRPEVAAQAAPAIAEPVRAVAAEPAAPRAAGPQAFRPTSV